MRPAPDVCEFIKQGEVKAFGTRRDEIQRIEVCFRTNRLRYLPHLKSFLTSKRAFKSMREFEHAVLRCALSKPTGLWRAKVANGLIDSDKLEAWTDAWRWQMQCTLQPPKDSLWEFLPDPTKAATAEEAVEVQVISDTLVPVEDAGSPPPKDCPFSPGTKVKLSQWRITGVARDNARCDVSVGRNGIVDSVDQESHRCTVVFECSSSSSSKKSDVRASVAFENLELVVVAAADPAPEAKGKAKAKSAAGKDGKPQEPEWLRKAYPDDESLEVIEGWEQHTFQGGRSAAAQQTVVAKSKVTLAIDLLNSQYPSVKSSEIAVVRRGKSVEVWTLVPFAKGKLVVVPFSTEIKDKYWSYGKSASIKTDLISKKTLALDGRLHHRPPAGKDEERVFSVFWAIGRTTVAKQANLTLEWVDVHVGVEIVLPNKRKLEADASNTEVKVPILINLEKVPAHTLLTALDDVGLHKVIEQQQANPPASKKQRTT